MPIELRDIMKQNYLLMIKNKYKKPKEKFLTIQDVANGKKYLNIKDKLEYIVDINDMNNNNINDTSEFEKFTLDLKEISEGKGTIRELFLSLMYHLFIKKEEPTKLEYDYDDDLLKNLGFITKQYNCFINPSIYKNFCDSLFDVNSISELKIDAGGNPEHTLKVLYSICIHPSLCDIFNINDDSQNSIKDVFLQQYQNTPDSKMKSMVIVFFNNRNNKNYLEQKKIGGDTLLLNKIPEIPLSFKIKKTTYQLSSSNLTLFKSNTEGHAICGYVCDKKPYLFDSNNYISDDEWNQFNVDKYYKFFKRNYYTCSKIIFQYLIYTKK
jgi:hypothetical protein